MSADAARRFLSPHHAAPIAHLLSNGRYGVMITAAGSGYSRCRELALTRWREDPTCDPFGQYLYLRDAGSGALWSAAYQPWGANPSATRRNSARTAPNSSASTARSPRSPRFWCRRITMSKGAACR